jgi:putative peptidoglycan lipid II flippase
MSHAPIAADCRLPSAHRRARRHPLIVGAVLTGLGTLLSRMSGLLRDMATASLLGLAGSGVADAFAFAYSIPNLFRRLFGEGALAASYLPVFSAQFEKDARLGWQLASVLFAWLTLLLSVLALLAEGVLGLLWLVCGDAPRVHLLLGLAAVMMPYLMLVCLAAQLSATLQALSRFSVPALVPTVLNLCLLAAAWWVAPQFAPDQQAQAYVLAVAVVVAGVLQVAVQVPTLRRLGFHFDYDWAAARDGIGRIVRTMAPMLIGLAVTQINTFNDRLMAWGLAQAADGSPWIGWLGGAVRYPLRQGAAAAIYYGERLYEFPVGMVGIAVATAVFPLLSRHAARGDRDSLAADLTLGLRMVICLAVPAGIGLAVLAEPLVRLLFEHGHFTADDTARAARITACYAMGVWAYCASHVLVRGFYALGDAITPVKIAAGMVGLNLTLNLLLIWPLQEAGFAVATSISATVQVLLLLRTFSRRAARLDWHALGTTATRTTVATLLLAAAAYGTAGLMAPAAGLGHKLAGVLVPLGAGGVAFCAAYWLLGGRELAMLWGGQMPPAATVAEKPAEEFKREI